MSEVATAGVEGPYADHHERASHFGEELRRAIRPAHDAIEQVPLAREMANGTVSRERYVALLVQMGEIHGHLEEAVASLDSIASLMDPAMKRRDAIERDLAHLEARPSFVHPARATEAYRRWVERSVADHPGHLLGALYVFEGSRMGSCVLAPKLAEALGLAAEPGNGLDYHVEGLGETPRRLRAFKRALGEIAAAQDLAGREILAGAVETMESLRALYEELSAPPSAAEPATEETPSVEDPARRRDGGRRDDLAAPWLATWAALLLPHPPLTGILDPLPDDLAHRRGRGTVGELGAWRLTLASETGPLAEVRLVRIRGPRIDILNVLGFPLRDDVELPVLATEVVTTGGAMRVAFLDLQHPGLGWEARARSRELARQARWATLSGGEPSSNDALRRTDEPAPGWATALGSGYHLFDRDDESVPGDRLAIAQRAYVERWMEAVQEGGRRLDDGGPRPGSLSLDALAEYKRHHVQSSPGTRFLASVFGQLWTERFLNGFLYA